MSTNVTQSGRVAAVTVTVARGPAGAPGTDGAPGSDASVTAENVRAAVPNIVEVDSPANDDMIQRVGGSWVTRTIAQVKAALGLGSAAYANTGDFQAPLVSGTNIKTINGNGLLGSGNLSVTSDLASGPVTSSGGVSSIADGAITFAMLTGAAAATHAHLSADITDATSSATPSTLVKRDANGGGVVFSVSGFGNTAASFHSENWFGVYVTSVGGDALSSYSTNGVGASLGSSTGWGAQIFSDNGNYHAVFGATGDDRSFVARLLGAFGWWRGAFTGQLAATGTLTANRTWTLPDASGAVALTASPAFTGTVTVGANTWNGSTITGAQAFSSATRPTSSGSGVPAANSLITLADAHIRTARDNFGYPITFPQGQTFTASGGTSAAYRGAWQLYTNTTAGSAAGIYFDLGLTAIPSGTPDFSRRMILKTRLQHAAGRAGSQFYFQFGRIATSTDFVQLDQKGFGFGVSGVTVTPFVHNGTTLTTTLATGSTFSILDYPDVALDFVPGVGLHVYGIPASGTAPVLLATITSGLPTGTGTATRSQLAATSYDTGSGGADVRVFLGATSFTYF